MKIKRGWWFRPKKAHLFHFSTGTHSLCDTKFKKSGSAVIERREVWSTSTHDECERCYQAAARALLEQGVELRTNPDLRPSLPRGWAWEFVSDTTLCAQWNGDLKTLKGYPCVILTLRKSLVAVEVVTGGRVPKDVTNLVRGYARRLGWGDIHQGERS